MTRPALAIAVVAVTVGGLLPGTAFATTPTGTSAVGDPGPDFAPSAGQPQACDFDALYDEAIDSVVTVRVWNEQGDRSQGSGWVYETNGSTAYVVTNWHVVVGALGVDVRFSDGEWRPATQLVGADFYSDLAVLKVENVSDDVGALSVAPSPPDQGDTVAALGSPLGLEGSITRGIVSAVDRAVTVQNRTIADTIQIDTPISPGSSGGPLVDCDGEVVGVNFAGAFGLDVNFAISAKTVEKVVPALVETGEYNHSYLGIRGVTLSPTIARVNEVNTSRGVLVVSTVAGGPSSGVLRGSPASERVTGIPIGGDVILAANGTRIGSVSDLEDYLFERTRPGQPVTLTVIRDGERVELEVILGRQELPRGRSPST